MGRIIKKLSVLLFTLALSLITTICFADAMRFNGWTTLIIPGEVEFQIPPTMEAQSESYKALMKMYTPNIYKGSYPEGSVKLMAQQKGLSDGVDDAKKHFVRATVQVITDNSEPLMPEFGKPLGLTSEDLTILEEEFLQGIKKVLNSNPTMRFLGVTQHAEVVYIDGNEAVHFSYNSQNEGYPPVYNDIYLLFNRNKTYRVSTMVRSTEYGYWTQSGADVRDIVRTLHPLK